MKIPNGHQTIMPYLILPGAEKFIEFTKKVFNGEEMIKKMRDDGKTVMHSEVKIGNSTIMFADTTDKFTSSTAGLFIYVDNADDTYNKAIDAGATTIMELSNQDYGRTCGIADPFGNTWWITSVE